MDKVLLFHLKNESIKITIEAFFDADGNLVIDGYDIGKTVGEYFGDIDYEYSTTVSPAEVVKLYHLLGIEEGAKTDLLLALQRRFNTNTCYSEIQGLLDNNGIRYNGFSWN